MNYLRKEFVKGTVIIGSGFGIYFLKPYIQDKWYSYLIHREIRDLVKEAIDTNCYTSYEIKSSFSSHPYNKGWKLDVDNKHFREAIKLLSDKHNRVVVDVENNESKNNVSLKYNKNNKTVTVSFFSYFD